MARSKSAKGASEPGNGCLRLFFLPFFLFGMFFLYNLTIQPVVGILRASAWKPTPCTIVSSSLGVRGTSGRNTNRVEVRYRYSFEGRDFESDHYRFGNISSNTARAEKEAAVKRFSPGSEATCYVNPSSPAEAVLNRGASLDVLWGLFPLPFVLVGLLGMIYAPKLASSGRGSGSGPISSTKRSKKRDSTSAMDILNSGTTTLRASSTPLGKVVGMLIFALIWNGVTSVFVYQIWKGFHRGRPEWFLTIFMIPFVLIGLATIFGVFYYLLALFNPRVSLEITPGTVRLGGDLQVRWIFTGWSTRIRSLQILLIGLEKTTYRRGTNTHTDQNTFAREVVVETTEPQAIKNGEVTVKIPSGLMHSFTSKNNEVIWKLQVKGDIPRFPDVDDEFIVRVLP